MTVQELIKALQALPTEQQALPVFGEGEYIEEYEIKSIELHEATKPAGPFEAADQRRITLSEF